jgi:SAM-dependent methyltransferase
MMDTALPWYVQMFNEAYMAHLVEMPEERTRAEVDFLEAHLAPGQGAHVLDLCCGTGRHAVELAGRGYRVSGLDLNADYLARARLLAETQGVTVELIQADMRAVDRPEAFAACYNWYSSFGYFETDSENAAVLSAVFASLINGGRFAIDVLNLPWFLKNMVPYDWRYLPDGSIILEQLTFDNYTGRSRYCVTRVPAEGGERVSGEISIRLYSLVELRRMLELAGFRVIDCWGGLDGSRCLISSQRCIVLAEKPA